MLLTSESSDDCIFTTYDCNNVYSPKVIMPENTWKIILTEASSPIIMPVRDI